MIKIDYRLRGQNRIESIGDCKTTGELAVYITHLMRKVLKGEVSTIFIEGKELDVNKDIEMVQKEAEGIAAACSTMVSPTMIN